MTTPAEAIEAQRQAFQHCASEPACIGLITGEELARLYAIKDAFEKMMEMADAEGICDTCDGTGKILTYDSRLIKCITCNGTGKRNVEVKG